MNKNIVKFPDRSAIKEEAGVWLIKLDRDQAPSCEELASLLDWLERSPFHREELGSLASFWGKMNVLTQLAVPLGISDNHVNPGFFKRLFYPSPFRFATFATFVLAVAISFIAWQRLNPIVSGNGLYATTIGQLESMTLADGSVLLLNTNSQIKVDYGKQFRNIYLLQGEVHFTVAKNEDRPFRVYARNGRIQAVGTAFSVYLKPNSIDVTVTEGRVALASLKPIGSDRLPLHGSLPAGDQTRASNSMVDDRLVDALGTIKAGERATIQNVVDNKVGAEKLDSIETMEAQEMANQLSWREGVLTFVGDPLEHVIEEISRYTTVSIKISDPAIRAIKIGGRFRVGETDAMLAALEVNFGLQVTHLSHDHVLLSAADK